MIENFKKDNIKQKQTKDWINFFKQDNLIEYMQSYSYDNTYDDKSCNHYLDLFFEHIVCLNDVIPIHKENLFNRLIKIYNRTKIIEILNKELNNTFNFT